MDNKEQFLNLIRSDIEKYGYHITIVNSPIEPRYAYTIGLSTLFNFELILAGGIYYLKEDLFQIFDAIVKELEEGDKTVINSSLGSFSLIDVDNSWSKLTMLGALNYYKIDAIKALQILPDPDHFTLDIPDMSNHFDISEPVWQWLVRKWSFNVPESSTVITNINSLKGEPVTEMMRWEDDEWQMFAGPGPDVKKSDIRVVSLGTMLGIDNSLLSALSIKIGKGLWREDSNSKWNDWG